MARTVACRLEGGLGDHILGLRLLPFIRNRFPNHRIIVYSDCGGYNTQLAISRISPHIDEVVPIFQNRTKVNADNWGSLDNIREEDLAQMRAADIFLDAWPGPLYDPTTRRLSAGSLFVPHSRILNVPYYQILASRPPLRVPKEAKARALEILGPFKARRYIAVNFEKYGGEGLLRNFKWLKRLLRKILSDKHTYILNIFSRLLDFPHYPEPDRIQRCQQAKEAAEALALISEWHPRIAPIIDADILTVAAILERCSYMMGTDNGIKHLAWALKIPKIFFLPSEPGQEFVLRWIPDYNDMRVIGNSGPNLSEIATTIRSVIT